MPAFQRDAAREVFVRTHSSQINAIAQRMAMIAVPPLYGKNNYITFRHFKLAAGLIGNETLIDVYNLPNSPSNPSPNDELRLIVYGARRVGKPSLFVSTFDFDEGSLSSFLN